MMSAKPLAERRSSGLFLKPDVMAKAYQRLAGWKWQRKDLARSPCGGFNLHSGLLGLARGFVQPASI